MSVLDIVAQRLTESDPGHGGDFFFPPPMSHWALPSEALLGCLWVLNQQGTLSATNWNCKNSWLLLQTIWPTRFSKVSLMTSAFEVNDLVKSIWTNFLRLFPGVAASEYPFVMKSSGLSLQIATRWRCSASGETRLGCHCALPHGGTMLVWVGSSGGTL